MPITFLLSVLLVSTAPIAQLRGGLPLALAHRFPPATAFLLAVAGNIVPISLLLWGLDWRERRLRRPTSLARPLGRLFAQARRKGGLVARWEPLALKILVAIPLPGTGA